MKLKSSNTSGSFAYEGLDRVIHERARLSVLTSLMTHPKGLSFVELKQLCTLTDGNLARHLQVLEEDGMIRIIKDDEVGRTQTVVHVTVSGRKRYLEYLTILEQVVRDARGAHSQTEQDDSFAALSPLKT